MSPVRVVPGAIFLLNWTIGIRYTFDFPAWSNTEPQKNGADQAIGRSRGGLTTKIHEGVDALGNPIRLLLTGGQIADVTQGEALITGISSGTVTADKGCDSDALVVIEKQGARANIPPRSNRNHKRGIDWHGYKARHLVECVFNRLKQFRRIATRYDKLACRFNAFCISLVLT